MRICRIISLICLKKKSQSLHQGYGSHFSDPLSGLYIGYTIQKGKLAHGLKYLIVKKKLDSQNNIFFEQLTLGDKVDSPDAAKLLVKLAIVLLRNRKGEINRDITVDREYR